VTFCEGKASVRGEKTIIRRNVRNVTVECNFTVPEMDGGSESAQSAAGSQSRRFKPKTGVDFFVKWSVAKNPEDREEKAGVSAH